MTVARKVLEIAKFNPNASRDMPPNPSMRFSLQNLAVFVAFAAWLLAIWQTTTASRGAMIFGTAAACIAISMVLALCSPQGNGQLDVDENSLFVVLSSWFRLVILFAVAVAVLTPVVGMLGVHVVFEWLRYPYH